MLSSLQTFSKVYLVPKETEDSQVLEVLLEEKGPSAQKEIVDHLVKKDFMENRDLEDLMVNLDLMVSQDCLEFLDYQEKPSKDKWEIQDHKVKKVMVVTLEILAL